MNSQMFKDMLVDYSFLLIIAEHDYFKSSFIGRKLLMVDIHCHILPDVDDGAQTLEDGLALARMAVNDGITHAFLTPHLHPQRYHNSYRSLLPLFNTFKQHLQLQHIPLQIFLGSEIRVCMEILELINTEDLPYIGLHAGHKVALFEFPHNSIPIGSEQFMSKMFDLKIQPIIAHPERNKAVINNPVCLRPFLDMGCLLQLTAASVIGEFGQAVHHTALKLIEDESAWVIASDAHNTEHRPPKMKKARAFVAEHYGETLAELMLNTRPAQFIVH